MFVPMIYAAAGKTTALLGAGTLIALATTASADILVDFNNATPVSQFNFNDAVGTGIQNTANSVDPSQQFDLDSDFEGAATNGSGQFNGSGKANTSFASSYVDIDGISSGTVYGLLDVSWSFDTGVYDPAQDEEFRLSLMQFDPRSTFVTAETFFRRTSATEVTLFGNGVGTGSSDTSSVVLGSSGSLLTLLEADLDDSTFTLHYSDDGGSSFSVLSGGELDPTRGIESFRFVLNEDFSDDTMLVERIAVSAIPEPTGTVVLAVLLGVTSFWRCRRC